MHRADATRVPSTDESTGDDHAHEPSTVRAVASIRMKAIGLAAGAAWNVFDVDARELRANGCTQIDERLVAFPANDECIADAGRDVGADFEAARPDAGTDRGNDRLRCEPLDRNL